MASYDWLLYSNEEKKTDCFQYNYRYFCHSKLENDLSKQINKTCIDGKLWSFSELKQIKVTTDELINWSIPFHKIEEYADYLNSTPSPILDTMVLCNCSENRIGPECEYELPPTQGIGILIRNQRGNRRSDNTELPVSLIDGILCNAGALDLEWRQVCDGIIHCQDAIDEFNCHLLEFNQCEVDEFQCRNGMCIPKEYLFDAVPDCMDLSDEQELDEIFALDRKCPTDLSTDCDERLCRKDQFSCADGTCVAWSSIIDHSSGCENSRDAAYLCETVDHIMTGRVRSNGVCEETSPPLANLTNSSDCVTSLRYLLIENQRKVSNETRATSWNNVMDRCPEFIQYPQQAILSPVLRMYYNKSWIKAFYQGGQNFHRQMPRRPHWFCLNGSMMCNGHWITLTKGHCFDQDGFQRLSSYPYFPINYLFCEEAAKILAVERNTSLKIEAQNQSDVSSFYLCQNTSDRLSLRRVNDGYIDCLYGDDERSSVHLMTKPFRYRCETIDTTVQYVSYQQLGNGVKECSDGSDEISREVRWSTFKCDISENYACWVFQADGITENRITNVRLAFHRHCDSVWDTMDGQDERNCTHWTCADNTYQCNGTGQCITRNYFCDGEFDCDDGEDELNCPPRLRQWILELECDNTYEHFCITSEYLKNQSSTRPCIPYYRAGDGKIDCVGGRDERNVFSCSDHLMLGDRFLCDNLTKCLAHTSICNGITDCLDQTDELICFWDRTWCQVGQFACSDAKRCRNSRCDPRDTCSNKVNWFWCPNSTVEDTVYRPNKYQRLANYETSCYKDSSIQTTSATDSGMPAVGRSTRDAVVALVYDYCNRGFYLTMGNGTERVCFCPPSFYGPRCQFNSRRIIVRVRFERRHRLDVPAVITVLVLLVYNNSQIIDHQFFIDANREAVVKYTAYLLYPRPRSPGLYTVRFEAYDSIHLLAAWNFMINPLDFLPVYRLAKILRFPDRHLPWLCTHNQCQNNATCYIMNNGQPLCLCHRGWQGIFCEKELQHIKCAPHSLARDRHVCICPYKYLEPHCFVRNTVCERSPLCPSKGLCYAATHQPQDRYWCICGTFSCENENTMIIMHRQDSNSVPFLLQLLKISSDYPRVKQQILVHASTVFPSIRIIKTYDVQNAPRALPEIGLLYKFQPQMRSVNIILHLLFINCSKSFRNYTVDLDIQPQQCRSLNQTELHSVKYLRDFCRKKERDPCFQLQGYICYCSSRTKEKEQSECISYHQRHVTCEHCLNQGYCVQGDLLNKSDFACVCPKCASGKLCQFSPSRFSISLEFLVEKTHWDLYHCIGPIIFLLVGMIFNNLSFVTFMRTKIHTSAIGIFFLVNSITSQLVLIFLTARVLYLYTARQTFIMEKINTGLCKSLPYLMLSLYYLSLWLVAFVTVERALVAIFPRRFLLLRSSKSAILLTTFVSVIIFGSNYIHIDQYKLVSHPADHYPWCIGEIRSNQQYLTQYLSLAHQIFPFLVNLIAGSVIIVVVSRSKASSHHLQVRSTLIQQLRKRIDLLLGPTICFITQLPQIIILFLDVCDYNLTSWFAHVTLVAYYISFTPQISLFFLYVLPSPLYRKTFFRETKIGRQLVQMIPSLAHLIK